LLLAFSPPITDLFQNKAKLLVEHPENAEKQTLAMLLSCTGLHQLFCQVVSRMTAD
jgi:hypothetical protein